MSSGIEADSDLNGPVVPFVRTLLADDDMLHFTGPTWVQTTQPLVDASDLLIFMNDDVYADAMERFQIPVERSQTWQTPDVQGVHEQIRLDVVELLTGLGIVGRQ